MTKREKERRARLAQSLANLGVTPDHIEQLRRISAQLHRWHELECGTGDSDITHAVERDEATGKTYRRTRYQGRNGFVDRREPCRDMKSAALARLAKVMRNYPALGFYVQGDPRGCALYILRPGDVPEGGAADEYYPRGLAIW